MKKSSDPPPPSLDRDDRRDDTSAPKEICPKYQFGRCNNYQVCKQTYDHPRRCRDMLTFGECKYGNTCQYYHPIFCQDSLDNLQCLNLQCPYFHLKFTKRHIAESRREYSNTVDQSDQTSSNKCAPPSINTFLAKQIRETQQTVNQLQNMLTLHLPTISTHPQTTCPQAQPQSQAQYSSVHPQAQRQSMFHQTTQPAVASVTETYQPQNQSPVNPATYLQSETHVQLEQDQYLPTPVTTHQIQEQFPGNYPMHTQQPVNTYSDQDHTWYQRDHPSHMYAQPPVNTYPDQDHVIYQRANQLQSV